MRRNLTIDNNGDRTRPGRSRKASIVVALILMTLTGCVSNRAIPEFKLYLATYNEASVTVAAVLDEFEKAEIERARALVKSTTYSPLRMSKETDKRAATQEGRNRIKNNGGFDDAFHIEDAIYNAANATPPITATFRRAWKAVGDYNAVLNAYADGKGLDEIKAELGSLSNSIGALGEVFGLGSSVLGSTVPGGSLVQTGLNIVNQALEAGNKEAFRNSMTEMHPLIAQTLSEMRNAAPAMFDILTSTHRSQVKDAATDADREKGIRAIETYRQVVSNWVVALDATQEALDRVIAAINAPETPVSLLADLNATSANATAVAVDTRNLLRDLN